MQIVSVLVPYAIISLTGRRGNFTRRRLRTDEIDKHDDQSLSQRNLHLGRAEAVRGAQDVIPPARVARRVAHLRAHVSDIMIKVTAED